MNHWARVALFCVLLASMAFQNGHAQLYFRLEAGPSLQSIALPEVTLTNSTKPIICFATAFGLTYEFENRLGIAFGLNGFQKGAIYPNSTPVGDTIAVKLKGNFAGFHLGVCYLAPSKSAFALRLAADFQIAKNLSGKFVPQLVNGSWAEDIAQNSFFNSPYIGLRIQVGAQYQLNNGCRLYCLPTYESGFRKAFNSNQFDPRFFGFTANFGIQIPITQ